MVDGFRWSPSTFFCSFPWALRKNDIFSAGNRALCGKMGLSLRKSQGFARKSLKEAVEKLIFAAES
jgi:hypothetical protein